MNKKIEVSISSETIRNILVIAACIFLIWKLSDIFILLITAIMIASALNPAVAWLHKKLSMTLSAAIIVICLILPLVYVVGAVIPDFIGQFPEISKRVTNALSGVDYLPPFLRNLDFSQYFQNSSSYLLESTKMITSFFFEAITFIFLIFYLLVDGKSLYRIVALSIAKKNRDRVEKIFSELGHINGRYIRGNLLISLICTVVIFTGLMLLHVPYALPLAIFLAILQRCTSLGPS